MQSGIVTRDDRRIDVAFSFRSTSRRHSVVARHPLGRGSSLFEEIFPLNEPIRARLFLLAPRPKSRRHHINKGWAWFEAKLASESDRCHVLSVAQDIIHCVTRGRRIKTAKHVGLPLAMKHISGSAKVVSLQV